MKELYELACADQPGTKADDQRAHLYRLAADLLLDNLRRQRASAGPGAPNQTRGRRNLEQADGPATAAERQRLDRTLAAVDALPEITQQVLRLSKFHGLSHAKIGQKLGISPSAVENYLVEALLSLVSKADE